MNCSKCELELFYYEVGVAFVRIFTQEELEDFDAGTSLLPQQYLCHKCLDMEPSLQ
jgi:hypothetical protein